ncbi:golgin subfamily A member 4 [Biomphalaria pfeifferi]|uniref:Golgin subfamily A member 4 n=1 Tax=Biomphalaria pfeifferi TaxID=112525 RepID=A0AAD8BY08_BIOPF|nr:golgin subfamily A member 4 [Biomphalaria pfeifferi]
MDDDYAEQLEEDLLLSNKKLKECKQIVNEKHNIILELRDELNSLRQELIEKDDFLNSAKKEISSLKKKMSSVIDEIECTREENSSLETALETAREKIQFYGDTLKQMENEFRTSQRKLQERDDELEDLRRNMRCLNERYHSLQERALLQESKFQREVRRLISEAEGQCPSGKYQHRRFSAQVLKSNDFENGIGYKATRVFKVLVIDLQSSTSRKKNLVKGIH